MGTNGLFIIPIIITHHHFHCPALFILAGLHPDDRYGQGVVLVVSVS